MRPRSAERGFHGLSYEYIASVLPRVAPEHHHAEAGEQRPAELQPAFRDQAKEALRESVEISQQRYLGGLATYLEVLDAQQQLYPAEFALAQTERDQLLAVVDIYRALGGGWNADAEEPKVPQPIMP